MKKIILASASPRRIEMMKDNGFEPEVIPAHIDERLPLSMTPEASVMYLALKKAAHVKGAVSDEDSIIIAADTVVVYKERIIGKPRNAEEAFKTLSELRADMHLVITGVCILKTKEKHITKICFYDKTSVFFKAYSDDELKSYVNTPEPYDKAGGYAIQGAFGKYVDHIDGNLDNVIGFPWKMIYPYIKA